VTDLRRINPHNLPVPRGYAHGILTPAGRTLFVAGQIGCDADGVVREPDLVRQIDRALRHITEVVREAGGTPERIARMTLYTTDIAGYRSRLKEIKVAWRRNMGSHYPAMSVIEVAGLFDPGAKIEMEATAVL